MRTRRRLVRRVPAPLRNMVMHLLASFDSVRSAMVVRALGGRSNPARHSPDASLRVVRVQGRHVRAVVVRGATEWAARARNLHLLVAVLDEAEIDHFAVRGTARNLPCVAVPARLRAETEEVLQLAFGRNPGYVAQEDGGQARSGSSATTWRRLRSRAVLRLSWNVCDPTGHLVFGPESGCDLEFWEEREGELCAPRPNTVVTQIPVGTEFRTAEQKLFSPVPGPYHTGHTRTVADFTARLPTDHAFPIDVVYTWVDDSDAVWRSEKDAVRRSLTADSDRLHEQADNGARYTSRDELRYSLRSIHQYAPWVRNIFLVTAGQTPGWLDTDVPGLTVVDHREIFSDPAALPTYNSHAIESQLHRIPGLSDHFLYLNDDVFFGRPVQPGHFFHPNGLTKFFLSKALIPSGNVAPEDLPVNAAGKNSRGLIAQQFGTVISQKMKHTPHALRRSVLTEIEHIYARAHWVTQHSRFRSPHDIPIASSLHHYYAYHLARATLADLRYVYIDIGDEKAQQRLNRLVVQRNFDTFCINDTLVPEDPDAQERMVRRFLDSYFPVASPFELHGSQGAPTRRTHELGRTAG
ncbi:stealth family protein [Streptomyces microflavus]|uniref:UDP-N-acetylglucosamine lysosomal-enzyme/N-acetyl glucosamine phosphotransferase n=1 Tax=Streptomyces microflavus DSM 40593 TaxID=1303692 RepID=N0D5V1_STRMI|nr:MULTISPECIES: stealth family protein [Streptomyces]AGK80867.1 UDP-N-acetylglucosamine lysosomal-enzyme/N-acetyl glucosamine phosphotransferase [Streptomyces microflavus DSM 40593]MCX4655927.1 stealth family protein [Streptomyces microflavus]MDX2979090.1 stealth family protein [Streptomyces sp. NRRL_B-2249]WSS38815.1 stealth family protein [Streptomyces microflavus]WST19944.1 stealth family protein [Streptomyces microflavus]